MTRLEMANEFIELLRKHAAHKATLYDGFNATLNTPCFLMYATEELGEVASAIIRDRPESARAECIDLAHTAMLVYMSLCDEQAAATKAVSEKGEKESEK